MGKKKKHHDKLSWTEQSFERSAVTADGWFTQVVDGESVQLTPAQHSRKTSLTEPHCLRWLRPDAMKAKNTAAWSLYRHLERLLHNRWIDSCFKHRLTNKKNKTKSRSWWHLFVPFIRCWRTVCRSEAGRELWARPSWPWVWELTDRSQWWTALDGGTNPSPVWKKEQEKHELRHSTRQVSL